MKKIIYIFILGLIFYSCNKEVEIIPSAVITTIDSFPYEVVLVTGGTYDMGSNEGDEKPIHQVTIDSFYMSRSEITNQQYAVFLNAINLPGSGYSTIEGTQFINIDSENCQISYLDDMFVPKTGKENFPVIEVTWYGAKFFSEYYEGYLPTEATWEYAARGGLFMNETLYAGSNEIDDVAWYYDNANGEKHAVGLKTENEIGLYDMTGNVMEWCNDIYGNDYYSSSPESNPQGPNNGTYRILRGGHYENLSYHCRVSNRFNSEPTYTSSSIGFRPIFNY